MHNTQTIGVKKIVNHQGNVMIYKTGSVKTKKLSYFENEIKSQLDPYVRIPKSGPLEMNIILHFKVPGMLHKKKLKKAERIALCGEYKTSVPDLDNSLKSIHDVICEFYKINDCFFSKINAEKIYVENIDSEYEYIEFSILPLESRKKDTN